MIDLKFIDELLKPKEINSGNSKRTKEEIREIYKKIDEIAQNNDKQRIANLQTQIANLHNLIANKQSEIAKIRKTISIHKMQINNIKKNM